MASQPAGWPPPTADDRTMATLAHALQLVGGWIAPLIIFLSKKDSLFVRFHALQALMLQLVYVACAIVFGIIWVATFLTTVVVHGADKASPPFAWFAFFPFLWLMIMAGWGVMITCAVVFSIRAGRGEWAEYPLLGRLARKFLNMNEPPVSQITTL